jgi:hypothetical protein
VFDSFLNLDYSSSKDPTTGEFKLRHLTASPPSQHQKRGVGDKLMKALVHAQANRLKALKLTTGDHCESKIKLYRWTLQRVMKYKRNLCFG